MSTPETPVLPTASPAVPRLSHKWIGRGGGWLVFLAFAFFWFCNVLYDQLVLGHLDLTPNTLVLGGFGMAAGFIYTIAYRLRPADGITATRLLLTFLVGGLLSTELAIFIESPLALVLGGGPGGTLLLHSLAGVIEEACKLATVVILARGLTVKNARTGLFLGGTVGFGFAAFEDMRYAFESTGGGGGSLHSGFANAIYVTYSRDLFGPFAHPILTALLAAALFATASSGRMRITGRVVLVYLAVAVVHGLIDTVPDLLAAPAGPFANTVVGSLVIGFGPLIVLSAALALAWYYTSKRVNRQLLVSSAEGDSPVGSAADTSSSSAPPTGSPSQ